MGISLTDVMPCLMVPKSRRGIITEAFAIDIYINNYSIISHHIQDLVASIFLNKQRLHLRIL